MTSPDASHTPTIPDAGSTPPPRRVLLLVTDLELGGTPTVVRELAIRLTEPGRVVVEVACLGRWGPEADRIAGAGVFVTALGASSVAAFPVTLAKLVRLAGGGRFDTVFSFLVHANAVAAAASAFLPDVRFLQSVQTTQPNPRWHWWAQRLVAVAADRVVVPSPSAAAAAVARAGVPAARVAVVPNAVDVASFDPIYEVRRPAGEPARHEGDPLRGAGDVLRVGDNHLRVGFVGRLDPVKRVPDLLAAAAGLPRVRVELFGDGADRRHVELAVGRLGMWGVVTLHGAVARPHDALAAIDVLVLPSAAEGFGLVLIEAMAAGVPVVGTDVPGIRDVIRHGRTGLLAPPGDAAALRAAILKAGMDRAWRDQVIPAARADVERRYAWPPVLAAYRKLLGVS